MTDFTKLGDTAIDGGKVTTPGADKTFADLAVDTTDYMALGEKLYATPEDLKNQTDPTVGFTDSEGRTAFHEKPRPSIVATAKETADAMEWLEKQAWPDALG